MTQREKFIRALKREKIEGHVPTFELVFYLTMEKLGKVHPEHRNYSQWYQMSLKERELHLQDMAYCYGEIARIYRHSAIFVQSVPGGLDETVRLLEILCENYGREYFIMMHGDPTEPIPSGNDMEEFSVRLFEEPQKIVAEERARMRRQEDFAEQIDRRGHLLDGFCLCADYCFNAAPFYSPAMFSDIIAPVLREMIAAYRALGYYTIKHTDGNILPIVDQIAECSPDALHSLDPQAGVCLADIKRRYGSKMTLIGNVNCGILQTGTREEIVNDTRRSLREGMPGYGYIFSTSNCVYTGLDLDRYELMHSVWEQEGVYDRE